VGAGLARSCSDIYYSQRAAAELERVLADFQADILVVERLWLHRYIAHARPFVRRIVFDAHTIEAELARQLAVMQGNDGLCSRTTRERLAERTESIERRAIRGVDQIWVSSEHDRRCVEQRYQPPVGVHVVPNAVDVASYAGDSAAPRSSACASLVFPAMFTYGPNATAAHLLINELMPLMRDATRTCRLVLVGSMPTAGMLDAARNDDRIVVTGTVPDVRPFLRTASVVVVPLFQGSGTRFKILEALAARVPVITTPIGAGGLDVEHDRHVLVAETAAESADAIERIWTEPDLVERLTQGVRPGQAALLVERGARTNCGRLRRVPSSGRQAMTSPLVSCIVPTYNGTAYLAEALESILAQTYQRLEIIVADDGSTDDTLEIAARYGPRVRVVVQANAGPAAARNLGVRAASGPFVAFLDQDDLWHREKLTRQLARFEARPELNLSVAHVQRFWTAELPAQEEAFRDHRVATALPGYITGTFLVRRRVFDVVGAFDTGVRYADSMERVLRARERGVISELLPDVLLRHRMHGRNLSQREAARSRDEFLHVLKLSLDRRRESTERQ
jgi:polysaccharide biosynthesis protein PslH